jgi:hypothetical protein
MYEMGKHEGQEKSDAEVQEEYEALNARMEEQIAKKQG